MNVEDVDLDTFLVRNVMARVFGNSGEESDKNLGNDDEKEEAL